MTRAPRPLLHLMLVAGLVVAVSADDAHAKGKRGGSSSSSSKSSSDGPSAPTINIKVNSSPSSSGAAAGAGAAAGNAIGAAAGAAAGSAAASARPAPVERTPEELAAIERSIAERAAADKAAAEKLEADRIAVAKVQADRAAEKAALERAEQARAAEAADKKRKEEALVMSDVDRVLARAKADYPILTTPEGEPYLRRILARQKQLAERGMYPSVAMVEAVADHAHMLTPQQKKEVQAVSTPAPEPKAVVPGCRWVTPSQWSCK